MTLLIDNRAALGNRPGLHALIAGVSHYRHLPGGGGDTATQTFGMEQLTSTALTAYKIFRWLQERQQQLAAPLATCRLLLSPSPGELATEPALNGLAETCTRASFAAEAQQWRANASSRNDDMTLFYFAGHGIARTPTDGVLILEDFGDPRVGGALTNAAEIVNIMGGMCPPADAQQQMARTQLYFVDACRVLPSEIKNFEKMSVPDIFDVELGGSDDRQAPIFFATIPGKKAYAMKNVQTLFSKALLKCLNGSAGDAYNDANDEVRWRVTVQSINKALYKYFDKLIDMAGVDQAFTLSGNAAGDPVVHLLDDTPNVEVTLEVEPGIAAQFTEVKIINPDLGTEVKVINPHLGTEAQPLTVPLNPHPFKCFVPAGLYTIRAKINPPNALYRDVQGRAKMYLPPLETWKGKVA